MVEHMKQKHDARNVTDYLDLKHNLSVRQRLDRQMNECFDTKVCVAYATGLSLCPVTM